MEMNKMEYIEFFKSFAQRENKTFSPYEFQKEVVQSYLSHNNFILQAPTGSGKTLATIAPFIYCWKLWKDNKQEVDGFPRKLIYSLPLRTLANSLYQEIKDLVQRNIPELNLKITLQTGENPNDAFFEGDIIFTTIDQTLSNILSIPLSLPNKLANINAGAVLTSYLIFDEFHLLDPKKSLSTTIIILNKLKKITQFCLMTATLTDNFINKISNYLKCDKIKVGTDDLANFSFIKENQRRIIHTNDKELTTEKILELHKDSKTIVICNTVGSCSQKSKDLSEYLIKTNKKIKLICLHSRFFQKDRKKREKEIECYFGKKSNNQNVIMITTQIIEVGLDISCDVMITEISPINSFLQRIGRSARWGYESNIFIFNPENKLPYKKDLSIATFEILNEHNNQILDFDLSNKLITEILSDLENDIYEKIRQSSEIVWDNICLSWQTGNKGFAKELIRDIHSINIVLIKEGKKINNLFKYESITIHPYSLKSRLNKILKNYEDELPNICYNLQPSPFSFDDENEDMVLTPIPIENIIDENIIALDSKYVGYSELTGLDFDNNYNITSPKKDVKKEQFKIKYFYDTFEEHIKWMIEVYQEMYNHQYTLAKIRETHYKEFDFDKLIRFMIITHDFGKLNNKWQEIVQKYQSLKTGESVTVQLAHTDFDIENKSDIDLMKRVYSDVGINRKPEHAGIGARFSAMTVHRYFEMKKDKNNKLLVDAIATSILRHHSAFAETASKYVISEENIMCFQKLLYDLLPELNQINIPINKIISSKIRTSDYSISFTQSMISFIYFIFN